MDSAINRLLKILDLERKQGYRNKAVIGGLDKFVSRWESYARDEVSNDAVISEVVSLLLGYAVVEDRTARERILDLIVRRVQSLDDEAVGVGQTEGSPAAPPAGTETSELPSAERPKDRLIEPLFPKITKPASPQTRPVRSRRILRNQYPHCRPRQIIDPNLRRRKSMTGPLSNAPRLIQSRAAIRGLRPNRRRTSHRVHRRLASIRPSSVCPTSAQPTPSSSLSWASRPYEICCISCHTVMTTSASFAPLIG